MELCNFSVLTAGYPELAFRRTVEEAGGRYMAEYGGINLCRTFTNENIKTTLDDAADS